MGWRNRADGCFWFLMLLGQSAEPRFNVLVAMLNSRPFRRALRRAVVLSTLGAISPVEAQSSGIRTYANPIDVDYRFNFEQHNQGISYRQGADPVIVNHGGEYFLFMTVSDGSPPRPTL